MSKKDLTIIIPFINERYELEETLKSIRDYSDNNIEVILINDASDDNFDYKSISDKYNAIYLENRERIGVAASRNIGVKACPTAYFLLLDAHMRFYDKSWTDRIIEELKSDPKTLLCCQTKALMRINGLLAEDISRSTSYGACVKLDDPVKLFEPKWITKTPDDPQLKIIPIPCVLGAGYACSKEYWLYLKGLEGLMQYGNDEAYISMKVWMTGGSCKLAKDIIIGHIYRYNHPYSRDNVYRLYNYLFLSEIFLPQKTRKKNLSIFKLFYDRNILAEAQYKLYENSQQIDHLNKYYKKIFSKDLTFFRSFNDQYQSKITIVDNINQLLYTIVERVTSNLPNDVGLIHGQMGIVIFLYHYAKISKNEYYCKLSDKILKDIIKNIKSDLSYCFISGLCGIGWGVEYLFQQGFIDINTNKTLEYIDKKIMEINPLRIEDIDKDFGFGGIVLYLLARLYTIHNQNLNNPFDELYLSSVYKRIREIIDQHLTESNSIDVFLTFLRYYENKNQIEEANIYDAYNLLNPKNIFIQDLEPDLKGCVGVGLSLILDECGQ